MATCWAARPVFVLIRHCIHSPAERDGLFYSNDEILYEIQSWTPREWELLFSLFMAPVNPSSLLLLAPRPHQSNRDPFVARRQYLKAFVYWRSIYVHPSRAIIACLWIANYAHSIKLWPCNIGHPVHTRMGNAQLFWTNNAEVSNFKFECNSEAINC